MTGARWAAMACGLAIFAGVATAVATVGSGVPPSDSVDLIKLESKHFDEAYIRPDADFRGYRRVMIDVESVAFASNWLKEMNAGQIALLRRTTAQDAARISEEARTGLGNVFSNAFKRAGYEVIAARSSADLAVSLRVIDMYINAPETITQSVPGRVYTLSAGVATLVLEIRDATTGVLLSRFTDRRTAGYRGSSRSSVMITSTVSNRNDFEAMFELWARSCIKSLEERTARPAPMAEPAR